MKLKATTGRKLRYGGTSVALTAAVIAVVIILNVLFTLLVQRYGLYVDLTPDLHFTISDECYDLIGKIAPDDGTDTPIEMVDKFRAENDAYNAKTKTENQTIAAFNAEAKKNNDLIEDTLKALIDKQNEGKADAEKVTYTHYAEYSEYKEYIDYTYDRRNEINKLLRQNEQIKKNNAAAKERNAKWIEAYSSMIPEGMAITEYKEYIEYKEDPTIKITFLTDKDLLENDETSKYVVFNVDEELRVKYPDHIWVEYVNAELHPARFTKYKNSPTDTIDHDSVIIECGSEFRVRTLRSFYIFENKETPVAYNGEKALASSILAVTRVASPLACYTTNHGEKFPESTKGNETPFIMSLQDAGYDVLPIDLAKQDIPEECRLLVVFNPEYDFNSDKDGVSNLSELDKLDDFLHAKNSLMVFMSPNSHSGRLDNFEDFLEEWGLAVRRYGNDPIIVQDTSSSISSNTEVIGDYAQNVLARGWLANLMDSKPYVVFPDAAALTYPDNDIGGTAGFNRVWVTDPEDETLEYYITVNSDTKQNRVVYDLFYSSPKANGVAAGEEILSATQRERLPLLSVSVDTYDHQEYTGVLPDSAYVMLCGSTEFASEKYLTSNTYGNSDFLLAALQMIGREPVPVGLEYKEFSNYTIESITANEATVYTVILTVAPLLIATVAGVVIIVRRKNR